MPVFEQFMTPAITGAAVALLVMFSVGGIIYGLFLPSLSGTKKRDARMSAVSARPQSETQRKTMRDTNRRKKSIQDQLKDFVFPNWLLTVLLIRRLLVGSTCS